MCEFDFELARKVEALAKNVKDSNPHWICTPGGEYETNNGADWCETCGRFMYRHLRRRDKKHANDYFFDGGWRTESDTHRFCAHCGCWLRVSLTGYGVEEEIEHYRKNGVGSDVNTAYSIDLLLKAISWGSEYTAEAMDFARNLVAICENQKKIETAKIIHLPCAVHCSICEGMDHHWLPDCDEEKGDPIMICKHCDAQRNMTDGDFE